MSEVSESPAVLAIAAVPAGLLVGGIVLAGVLVRKLVNSLDQKVQARLAEALASVPPPSAESLKPLKLAEEDSRIYVKSALHKLDEMRLPPTERIRLSALVSLAAGPYLVDNPPSLERPMAALLSAKTPEETIKASDLLRQAVHSCHRAAFTRGLTNACSNAIRKIGFSAVETGVGTLGDVRIVGTDENGRALVVEIRKGKDGDPGLAAEVLGVRDGSCHRLLDRFEEALAEQGVRYAPTRRTTTGGICHLQGARDFVRRRVSFGRKANETESAGTTTEGRRRVQKLNQQNVRHGQ